MGPKPSFEIIYKDDCAFSTTALKSVNKLGLPLLKHRIDNTPEADKQFQKRMNEILGLPLKRYTYPQVFINEVHVGGCQELMEYLRIMNLK